jgi:MFS family permease
MTYRLRPDTTQGSDGEAAEGSTARMSDSQAPAITGVTRGKRYIASLIALAFAGWALACYDFNLLVVAMPDIGRDLELSASALGLLGFIIYVAQFVITLAVGASMDRFGRKKLFQWVLVATAVFTGLTYFVQDFWQLALVRALAGGFATAELAVAITLVNEEAGARTRGMLYSIVQGGWPVGVFLASGVYLAFHSLGWRTVFALGVLPLLIVIVCRRWLHESDRWEHVHAIRTARASGNEERVQQLLAVRPVTVEELDKVSIRQLLSDRSGIRPQLIKLGLTWFCYGTALVATNIYITYWLTTYRGWSSAAASTLLLVSGGLGFFFYVLGGWLGERYGRRSVLIVSAGLTPVLALVFLYADAGWLLALSYFFLYQTTNGTWSGSGYAYWAESFPTRVRGTACGFLAAIFSLGNIAGTGLWAVLIDHAGSVATWILLAVALSAVQFALTLTLRRIRPGQQLEAIST